MGSFRPNHIHHGASPKHIRFSDKLHCLRVQFLQPHLPIAIITHAFGVRPRPQIISFPVIIKENRRINSRRPLNEIWIRPWPGWICCCNDEITAMGYICCDHIKSTFMIANRRSKNPLRMPCSLQVQLRRTIKHVADLLPVH
ncbi:hypothetical protein D3C77_306700 [compost metagenome]